MSLWQAQPWALGMQWFTRCSQNIPEHGAYNQREAGGDITVKHVIGQLQGLWADLIGRCHLSEGSGN